MRVPFSTTKSVLPVRSRKWRHIQECRTCSPARSRQKKDFTSALLSGFPAGHGVARMPMGDVAADRDHVSCTVVRHGLPDVFPAGTGCHDEAFVSVMAMHRVRQLRKVDQRQRFADIVNDFLLDGFHGTKRKTGRRRTTNAGDRRIFGTAWFSGGFHSGYPGMAIRAGKTPSAGWPGSDSPNGTVFPEMRVAKRWPAYSCPHIRCSEPPCFSDHPEKETKIFLSRSCLSPPVFPFLRFARPKRFRFSFRCRAVRHPAPAGRFPPFRHRDRMTATASCGPQRWRILHLRSGFPVRAALGHRFQVLRHVLSG